MCMFAFPYHNISCQERRTHLLRTQQTSTSTINFNSASRWVGLYNFLRHMHCPSDDEINNIRQQGAFGHDVWAWNAQSLHP